MTAANSPFRNALWIRRCEVTAHVIAFLGFLLLIAGAIAFHYSWVVGILLISPSVIAFVLEVVCGVLFYHAIICTNCRHNPTRRKDGKYKAFSIAWADVYKRPHCKKCGAGAHGVTTDV